MNVKLAMTAAAWAVSTMAAVVGNSAVFAGDWPQFLGPSRNAVSTETGLMDKWPADGPAVLWTVEMGLGFGGAAVAGDEVYVLDRLEDEQDALRVIDLKSGKENWRYVYDAPGRSPHPGSRSTPSVDGDRVLTVGSYGDVHCFSRSERKVLWKMNLNERFGVAPLKWAYAQSPLVDGDSVIVTPLSPGAPALVALDKATGKVAWTSEQKFGGDYYSSPIIATVGGVRGVMVLMSDTQARNMLLFADASTGKTLWTFTDYACKFTIPAPTVLPDGKHIFVTGGYDAGSLMLTVEQQGQQWSVKPKWRITEGSQIHPAVVHDGYLYANINTNTTLRRDTLATGGLACINPADGKVIWRSGASPNFDRGGFILVGNRIIMMEGQIGDLVLIEPGTGGYREISRLKSLFPEGRESKIWAPLALSQGMLVVRDQHQLKCLDLRAK